MTARDQVRVQISLHRSEPPFFAALTVQLLLLFFYTGANTRPSTALFPSAFGGREMNIMVAVRLASSLVAIQGCPTSLSSSTVSQRTDV